MHIPFLTFINARFFYLGENVCNSLLERMYKHEPFLPKACLMFLLGFQLRYAFLALLNLLVKG